LRECDLFGTVVRASDVWYMHKVSCWDIADCPAFKLLVISFKSVQRKILSLNSHDYFIKKWDIWGFLLPIW
jgi:hypothetical protein